MNIPEGLQEAARSPAEATNQQAPETEVTTPPDSGVEGAPGVEQTPEQQPTPEKSAEELEKELSQAGSTEELARIQHENARLQEQINRLGAFAQQSQQQSAQQNQPEAPPQNLDAHFAKHFTDNPIPQNLVAALRSNDEATMIQGLNGLASHIASIVGNAARKDILFASNYTNTTLQNWVNKQLPQVQQQAVQYSAAQQREVQEAQANLNSLFTRYPHLKDPKILPHLELIGNQVMEKVKPTKWTNQLEDLIAKRVDEVLKVGGGGSFTSGAGAPHGKQKTGGDGGGTPLAEFLG